MTLRVVGSGLGRTGTTSLKAALETLLGGRCYHMMEVFGAPDHPARWLDAAQGRPVDWSALFVDHVAAVDWPASAFWRELAEAYPDALVLHSERPAEDWFRSADRTIFERFKDDGPYGDDDPRAGTWHEMVMAVFRERFTPDFLDRDAAIAAYEAWNAGVRATAPADRFLVWETGDGWEPICAALDLPVPDQPFPHANTTEDFRRMSGLDG